jgi:hemerythrin
MKMLEELDKVKDKYMKMRDFLPLRTHRSYKESFLNKTVMEVRVAIRKYQRDNQ